MSYKVVRNSAGEAICFGPNDGQYKPGIPVGCKLFIEDSAPLPSKDSINSTIKAQLAVLDQKRIRSLAEGDSVYLSELNDKIKALRAKLL